MEPVEIDQIEHYKLKHSALLNAFEQFYLLNKRLPRAFTPGELNLEKGVSRAEVLTICLSPTFTKHLRESLAVSADEVREAYHDLFKLPWDTLKLYLKNADSLSPPTLLADRWLNSRQLAAINTLLDTKDTRSHTKKLQELQITSAEWQAWNRDPDFQVYLRRRSESQLEDSEWEANVALIDNLNRGNLAAIQYYYKLIGKDPDSGSISQEQARYMIQAATSRIMEVLAQYVTVDTLEQISRELGLTGSLSPALEEKVVVESP